jgi:trimeric autotransporter adhesin
MKQHQLMRAVGITTFVFLIHSQTFSQTDWHVTGNAGTNASTNFIGTTDNQGLSFRTNNSYRMRIQPGGAIGIGTITPLQRLDVAGNINIGKGFGLFVENKRVLKIDSTIRNTFLGNKTGAAITSGWYNTATGWGALAATNTGSFNAAFGFESLTLNTSGSYNTAIGASTMRSNTTGSDNTATGFYAMFANTTGYYNVANGETALSNNTTGFSNSAFGYRALISNTTGNDNAGFGKGTLYWNTTGAFNTAVGNEALFYNTEGYNTAVGYQALYSNTTGTNNTASGWSALTKNTTGTGNTAFGIASIYSNVAGNYNTAVGNYALFNTSSSSNNTALGDIAGASFQNGWNNVFLGAEADATAANIYNSIAIGNQARVSAPNQVRIGNTFTTSIGGYAGWSTISDKRLKKNIKDNVPGLEFINKLQAVTYNLDLEAADKFLATPAINEKGGKSKQLAQSDAQSRKLKEEVVYTGFLAQDVEKAANDINYKFSGVDAPKSDKDVYSLRYSEFVVPLVKAVQELSQQVDELKRKVEMLEMQGKSTDGVALKNDGASLDQNSPNPFSPKTTISYTLPQTFTSALINITDNSGRLVKRMTLTGKGKGTINIDASAFSSGTYNYSLIVDGKLIGSKQMILAK